MRIGQYMKPLVDEVSTVRIALSCHFALDTLCDKEGGAGPSDFAVKRQYVSRPEGTVAKWPRPQPKVGRRLGTALCESKTTMKVTVTTTVIASDK